jgi:two-component system NtrC family response regulator
MENAIERIVLLTAGNEVAETDLPEFLRPSRPVPDPLPVTLPEEGMSLGSVERQLILQALEKFHGNQTRAAKYLGMSRRTLAYRLEKYGILSDTLKTLRQSV